MGWLAAAALVLGLASACGGTDEKPTESQAGGAGGGADSEACETSSDCAADEYCKAGECLADVCESGEKSCDGNVIRQCNPNGGGYTTVLECPDGAACGEDEQGQPECEVKICAPGATTCLANDVVGVCSADGERYENRDVCGASDSFCVDGACEPRICQAGTNYCKGGDVYTCDARGSAEQPSTPCDPASPCNPETVTCEEQICQPQELACETNAIQTCNATGHEWVAGEACGALTCSQGACIDCADVDIRKALRFLQIRQTHIYVYNRSGCTLDLEGVGFDIAYYAPEIQDIRVDNNVLPSFSLLPESFVALSFLPGVAGTIYVDGKGPFDDGRDAYVLLCDGACDGSNVLDAVKIGDAAPELPAPVTFAGKLEPSLTSQYMSREWSFAGEYPSFTAADWKIYAE
jgi:hypothetical protein